jgi:hypothetical protein
MFDDKLADRITAALWLGHEDLRTVQCYLHADLALKERALARVAPPNTKPGRYLAFPHKTGQPLRSFLIVPRLLELHR